MGFDSVPTPPLNDCEHFYCNWKIPPFKFPTLSTSLTSSQSTTEIPETTTTMDKVYFMFSQLFPNGTNANPTQNVLNVTSTDVVKLESPTTVSIFENATSSNNIVSAIAEVTSSSSFTNIIQSSTSLPEFFENSPAVIAGNDSNNTVFTAISEVTSSAVSNVTSEFSSTTQNVITFITEAINKTDTFSTTSKTIEEDDYFHQYHQNYHNNHFWLYVILGIIIGILVLIGILLLLIYIRYKKLSRHPFNYYEINPMKEMSKTNNQQQKSRDNNVYVQYAC